MIRLYFSNGQAFVWNADDWAKIRQEYRIIGELIGTIASQPRQDVYSGLPLALTSEEAALLVEEGFAELVEYEHIDRVPNDALKKLSEDTDQRLYTEQIDCMKKKRIEQLSSRIDMIVAGKQKKSNNDGKSFECNKDALLKVEIEKLTPLSLENSLIQIPVEHPWPRDVNKVSVSLLVPNITSGIGLIRYKVFKDLWKRGYVITTGTKFGGDFLVYLGDPVKFHAALIVKCLPSDTSKLSLSEIVAYGRLAVSVNKLSLYAYVGSDYIKYQTLQWHETLY